MASSKRDTTGTKLDLKSLRRALVELRRELLGKYRPERHYMRGPGPRSSEQHEHTKVQH